MQGQARTLVNPAVSSRDEFAKIDARRELEIDEANADEAQSPEQIARGEYIAGLRELADWLEANPKVHVPEYKSPAVRVYGASIEQIRDAALTGRTFDKTYYGTFFEGSVSFSGGVKYEITAPREEVCVKRVTGTKHVEAHVIEAHDVDIVEWDCKSILGS